MKKKNLREIAESLTEEDKLRLSYYFNGLVGIDQIETYIYGREEISEEDNSFKLDKVYSRGDVVEWGVESFEFIGKAWRVGSVSGSAPYTQEKTIGMYPSEMFGWRKL